MIPNNQNPERDKKAMVISLVIHGIVAVLFIFILAWREPDPPIPEYGIELNLGVLDSGFGDEQSEIPPSPAEKPTPEESTDETTTTEEAAAEEQVQTAEPEPTKTTSAEEAVEEVETFETPSPDLVEPEVQEEIIQEEIIETIVEEVIEEIETIPTEEVSEEHELPAEIIEEEPVEVAPEVIAPVDEETTVEGTATETNEPAASNQGDQQDEIGDQGDPEGELDARALYGTPGAADGAALELSGWNWDYLPEPDDKSIETGRIVFEITIDDAGYIIGIKTLEKTVTPAVEKVYRDEVLQLTFSPTTDNSRPAPTSTGRITFIIKTK